MLFSAYQIESLLADFEQINSSTEKSKSETLSLSEDAIQDARKYLRPQKRITLDWVSPKDIMKLVEDDSSYDPVVDNVQQSRAGRFVVPAYVPEEPAPKFPLVSDHTQVVQNSETADQESSALSAKEENFLSHEKSNESQEEDGFSVRMNKGFSNEKDFINKKNQDINNSKKFSSLDSAESPASFFDGIDEDENDEEHDDEVLRGENSSENDVVFGDGPIDLKSMREFVANYPDSTIKFLMRKNLDGRPLPIGYEEIYSKWENRGLSRGRLKKYLYKLMEWKNFPDIPVHEVVEKIREHQYFLKKE